MLDEHQVLHELDAGESFYNDLARGLWWAIRFYVHQLGRGLDPRTERQGAVAHHSIKKFCASKAGGVTGMARGLRAVGLGF
jgi:hypothetical protein